MCSAFSPLVGSLAKRVTLKCETNLRKTWLLSALAALWEVEGEGKRGGEEKGEGEGGRGKRGGEGIWKRGRIWKRGEMGGEGRRVKGRQDEGRENWGGVG